MSEEQIHQLMNAILARQGRGPIQDGANTLDAIGFRSLDFSELALRVERAVGRELNFDARLMRTISTVADVTKFFLEASRDS